MCFLVVFYRPHRQTGVLTRKGKWISWKCLASYSRYRQRSLDGWELFCPSTPTRRVDRSRYQEYSTENLSDTQRAMLDDLRDYGLIWQRKAKAHILHNFFKH
jgi:hypothetical protein